VANEDAPRALRSSDLRRYIEVREEDEGKRLDALLAERVEGLSRSKIQRMIRDRWITVDGVQLRNNSTLTAGAVVQLVMPPADRGDVIAEDLPLDILYEDEEMLVVNKAAEMVVHPARGNYTGTLVNALLHHCDSLPAIKGETRPGIVHRLDKGTSGLLLVAKTDLAQAALSLQLKMRKVRKFYRAITWGRMEPPEGAIDFPIGRHPKNPKLMSVRKEPGRGRPSLSVYRTLEDLGRFSDVEVDLRTGRTHQIRVHFRYVGRTLLADPAYGGRTTYLADLPREARLLLEEVIADLGRQALHAWRISFRHPGSGEAMSFEAPLPVDMERALTRLRAARDAGLWRW
jgi:23S rRNA pseudouridine1911/1915/1917 synthase